MDLMMKAGIEVGMAVWLELDGIWDRSCNGTSNGTQKLQLSQHLGKIRENDLT